MTYNYSALDRVFAFFSNSITCLKKNSTLRFESEEQVEAWDLFEQVKWKIKKLMEKQKDSLLC